MTVLSQQVYGGHGYIEEHGMSQFTRDARIAQIYEGANGVQALDLVGRKLAAGGRKPIMGFFEMVKAFCKEQSEDEAMGNSIEPLKTAFKHLQASAILFMQLGMKTPVTRWRAAISSCTSLAMSALALFGKKSARAALDALENGASDLAFYETKLTTARYYMARRLPAIAIHLAHSESGVSTVMALDAKQFSQTNKD